MGFVRDRINDHLVTETRRESFKIHASHKWQPVEYSVPSKDGMGIEYVHGAHLELAYEDLKPLILDLLQIALTDSAYAAWEAGQKEQAIQDQLAEMVKLVAAQQRLHPPADKAP